MVRPLIGLSMSWRDFSVSSIEVCKMIETTVITVKGMSCSHCVEAIDGALLKINGVNSASANLDDGTVMVVHDVQKVSREALVRAVTDLGYEAN